MVVDLMTLISGEQKGARPELARALTVNREVLAGGSGLGVDRLTFGALLVHPFSVPTSYTLAEGAASSSASEQNVARAAEAGLAEVTATKIGLLPSEAMIASMAGVLTQRRSTVIDPELASRRGALRASDSLLPLYAAVLFREAAVVCLNRVEAEILAGHGVDSPQSMKDAAKRVFDHGPKFVLVTGGHLDHIVRDYFYDGTGFVEFGADRIKPGVDVGAGAVLSAAITARIAHGAEVVDAVADARAFVSESIRRAYGVGERFVVNPLHELG